MDEATRWQYEAREAWLKDEATRQYEAEQRGEQRGWTKGRDEGLQEGKVKADIASALAFLDIADDATIATKLSLPVEIVKRLRAGEDAEKSRKNY